ncbi:MAG: MBL fold metallo-hydrolase [Treponema sp.]|uniref:MBL fold metallo-hydrolase n=1 Tax=Treponema sp. TaxID=166 RepID=UPI00298EB66F|nr:MBL fold metallo-hydrolase [Treponema sp.]MBR5934010.1 MBL fold metallo-hydrolase [Treponema sp.]
MEDKVELFIKQLTPDVYMMDEGHMACGYIVVGNEKVCVIDTMNGFNDVKKAVREITDKPIIVVNTHGHPDHIYGNIYFDEAYINPDDLEVADAAVKEEVFVKASKEFGMKMPPFKPIKEGDVIDLGGKTLEVYNLAGHTPGGIVLLLKEDRILFTGDSVNHHLWMMLDESLSLAEYAKSVDRILFLEDKADRLLHGHTAGFDDISLLRCLRNGVQEILDGKTENDKDHKWDDGVCRQHNFKVLEGKNYSQTDEYVIYYNR